jgi:Holliday junction resolvase RusA-like endonuclease
MLLFEIHIPPTPQKQTKFYRRGNFVKTYDPSAVAKEQIQWQIKAYAPEIPLDGPLKVDLTFYLPIPKSISKVRKRQMINQVILPVKRPDVDNLAYLVTNAMKNIIYMDDSQLVDLCMHKRYGEEPRTVVKIIPICNSEQTRADECG